MHQNLSSFRLCYLSRNYRNITSSGNKAKTDNEQTLREMGAVCLGLPASYHPGKVTTFVLDLMGIVRYMGSVRRGDIIVLQYPVKKYFSFVCRMAHLRGARVIALIHDLGSMRRKKLTVSHEIERLMHADYVIASNATMQQWLVEHGYQHPTGHLQLFDYRSSAVSSLRSNVASLPRLVYAGALAPRKNTFLLQMDAEAKEYQLVVYGNRDGLPSLKEGRHMKINGFMSPEEFIAGVEGEYGLVWDGDSLDSCTGSFGEYLRLNSPHKASFYLRAGLPLVVWSHSALAPIVESEGMGLVIDDIGQLNSLLPSLSPDHYRKLCENVGRVSHRLATGQYFREALSEAIKMLTVG